MYKIYFQESINENTYSIVELIIDDNGLSMNWSFKRKYFIKEYNLKDCLALSNIMECEAHRELFITGLKEKIRQYEKGENK